MLDERKRRILDFIIQDYVDTAVPVGSRTITRKYNVGVSPATIRNEMSDLEALGYLEQPHVSAGRVPSVKAYQAAKGGDLPGCLVLGLSALIAFYRGAKFTENGDFVGTRGADSYTVLDDAYALKAFDAMPGLDAPEALARAALSDAKLWGEDLTALPGLEALVAKQLKTIHAEGMRTAIAAALA